jgi:branched-chain amino acid transport system substrate-binding protein
MNSQTLRIRARPRFRTLFMMVGIAALVAAGCSSSSKSSSGSVTTAGTAAPATTAVSSPSGGGSSGLPGFNLPFNVTVMPYGTVNAEASPAPPAPAAGNGGVTATGVTASTITVGEIASLTTSLFQGLVNSAQAYANYVNSLGGVYGRKIKIKLEDDGLDVVKGQAVCQSLIPSVFAMVANFSLGDSGCYPLLQSTHIPWLSPIVFDPRLFSLPNVFTPRPDYYPNLEMALELSLHPEVKKVWLCEQNEPGIAAQAAPEAHAWESLGVHVLTEPPLPANSPDYTAAVLRAKDDGAQAVDCFSTQPNITAEIAQEMAQQNWNPPIKRGFSVYDPNFLKLAGSAGKGWTDSVQIPLLDPSLFLSTPAGQLYQKWVGKLPATVEDPYGWEYMDMFVQGLVKDGPDLTQSGLIAALGTLTNFTADGLVPPFNAGSKTPSQVCLALVEDTGTGYQQLAPAAPGKLVCGGQYFS